MNFINKINNISVSWRYFFIVLVIYVVFLVFDYDLILKSLTYCGVIASEVLQAFLIVFVLMVLGDYYITPSFVKRYLDKNHFVKWLGVVIGGIISTGPIYMWYPLLGDLRKRVLNDGMVACFLYNRAIKIPLIPVALIYFDWKYLLVLGLLMVLFSIIQGMIINVLMRRENENCYSV